MSHTNAGRYSDRQKRRLAAGLKQATQSIQARDWPAAVEALEDLADEFDNSLAVLSLLVVTYVSAGRSEEACHLGRILLADSPDHPELYVHILAAAQRLNRPATMLLLARAFLESWPDDDKAEMFRDVSGRLVPMVREELDSLDLSPDQLEEGSLAEEMTDAHANGRWVWAAEAAEAVLKRNVEAPKLLRDTFLALWSAGRVPQALTVAEKLRVLMPDPLIARVNAIQCLVLLGKAEEARVLAEEIKATPPEHTQLPAVLLALAYLKDSQAIKERFDRARQDGHRPSAWEYNMAGTAESLLGNHKAAQRYWHRALNRDPDAVIAGENLEAYTASQGAVRPRFVPFEIAVPAFLVDEVRRLSEGDATATGRLWRPILTLAPWLPAAIPGLLRDGDRRTRIFALRLAVSSDHAELHETANHYLQNEGGLADVRLSLAEGLVGPSNLQSLLREGRI